MDIDDILESMEALCDRGFQPQSGNEQSVMMQETVKAQNIQFSDQHAGYTTSIAGRSDPTRSVTDTTDTELSNFFSRPIKITSGTWAVGGGIDNYFNPWALYFTNPRVENRITNYSLLRANLHVKIVVNGNGFYYGRAMASYYPFPLTDTLSTTTNTADLVTASQRPKIMLDPTTSSGGEMLIPFHSYENNAEVQSGEIAVLGNLWIRSINSLKHANGATDPITYSVFAWAEDVELSVLTSMDVTALTPQSGDETDVANMKGIVSGPATAVSKVAAAMSAIPPIAPFATATSTAAAVVAGIASSMGYCKPAVTKAPEPYRPTPISTLALTNVPDVTNKLTVDHKQELTIDPIIAGYGEGDLLSIKSIAQRESFLVSFPWAVGTSAETSLSNFRVDPVMWREDSSAYIFTAPAAASLPFKYWSGTLNYRFQFVCSAFHKGRVKIVFDPNQIDGTEYNTNYMRVVDLAEEQDVTVSVGMSQMTTLREHMLPGTDVVGSAYSITSALLTKSNLKGNGIVGVYVINELTTPDSVANNDISVNVYVSAGDDFEVFVPDDYFQQFVFKPQMGVESEMTGSTLGAKITPDGVNTDEPNKPIAQQSTNLAVDSYAHPKTNLVYTGESITSFRTMLKRYNRWMAIAPNDDLATEIVLKLNNFPLLRGNVAGAVHTTGALASYTYCNTVLLHWVTYMFSGWRGSLRYKLLPRVTLGEQVWQVSRRSNDGLGGYSLSVGAPNSLATQAEAAQQAVYEAGDIQREMSGVEGIAYTNSSVNPVLEWEVPFYSQYRYVPGKIQNHTVASDFTEHFTVYGTVTTGNTAAYSDIYVAAGEDFQTYIFSGLPRMYFELTSPAS